jgi:hypothetical protein
MSALALVAASSVGAGPAAAKAPTKATARFVDMAVTPDFPDGTPVDVYVATTVTSRPSNGGGKITAYKPAPKKLVPKLGFGAATRYLTVPIGAQFLVTAAGKPDVLASGGVDAGGNGYGTSDTYEIHTNGDPITADVASTTTTTGLGYTSPLTLVGYNELQDFTYSDGTGRPIKDAAVLLTHTSGLTGADDEDTTWQMGVVGKGCLPEFLTNGNEDSDYNPETLGVGTAGGLGIEYVASDPGSLELGLWKTDSGQTDCSGSPIATATANVAAGTRSYLYWYGPVTSPKLLVLGLPTPKGEKSATNSSPDAYTGSAGGGSTTSSDDSSSSTSTTASTTRATSP